MNAPSNDVTSAHPGRRRSARPLVAVALVTLVALVVSGCNAGAGWIARIDQKPIDSPNFWAGVPLYGELVTGGQDPTTGEGDRGISPMSSAAQYAMFLVQLDALKTLNARNGTDVPESAEVEVRNSLMASPQADQFRAMPGWFVDQIVDAQANFQALVDFSGKGADLGQQIKAYYEDNPDQFKQVCMSVISGEEAELMAAKKTLEDGSDFATVAKAVATQQPPGPDGTRAPAMGEKGDGDVGCVPMSTVNNLFADPSTATLLTDAEPEALVGPLPVAGGTFMLFQVHSTKIQTLEEATPTIQQSLGQPGQKEAEQALNKFLQTAHIELNPRIGSWTTGVGYAPPTGAEQPPGADPTTLVPSGALG